MERHTNCVYDYIDVHDGSTKNSPKIGRYCNENPRTVESTGRKLFLHFHSDSQENRNGFRISYVAERKDTVATMSSLPGKFNTLIWIPGLPEWSLLIALVSLPQFSPPFISDTAPPTFGRKVSYKIVTVVC